MTISSRGHREAVRWGPLVEGDLADRALVLETLRRHEIAAVMHFAAFAYVGESVAEPALYFRNNVANSLTLVRGDGARSEVRQIVFSSTCATYGLPDRMPIAEDAPQRPVNPYGEIKLMIERMLHWFGPAHGLRYAALRYFNAAGADPEGEIGEDHEPETHLIPLVLLTALGRRASHRHLRHRLSDAGRHRDPRLYPCAGPGRRARAGARASRSRAATASRSISAPGAGHSVREVIDAAERVTGRTIARRETARRAGDPPSLVADREAARKRCSAGGRSCSDLDDIIASAWAWHRAGNPARAT